MARPNRSTKPSTESSTSTEPTEEPTMTSATIESTDAPTESTDAPTESTDTASTDAPTEAAPAADAKPVGPTPEEKVATFRSALESATTVPFSDEVVDLVKSTFRALRGGSVKQASAIFAEVSKAAMKSRDIDLAEALLDLQDACMAPAPKADKVATPAVPVDPTEAYVARVTPLALALADLARTAPVITSEDGTEVTVGVPDVTGLLDGLDAYRTWVALPAGTDEAPKPESPEVSPAVLAAYKILSGKGVGTATRKSGTPRTPRAEGATRRDIGALIVAAFEGTEDGTVLTPTEISNKGGADYAAGEASTGAISNRIKAGTVEGIVATEKDGNLAAMKA